MARKVLISFLGTGATESKREGIHQMREYRTANYKIGEKLYNDYTFMSAALAEHYHVDKVLMVGTVHSMWEELYRRFSDKKYEKKVEEDEVRFGIYQEIVDFCENARFDTPLKIPHQKEVEDAMGAGSKVVLIKYGVTDEEIRENINTVLRLQDYLEGNDELIVDITHSFRSLPIFIMNLLIYLQNVSPKKVKISHIHYGMNEVYKEFGFSPVVDLKAMMDVQEWITGAYAFATFGNAYKISQLLEHENKSVAPILQGFSDAMNLNYLYPMRAETQKLSGLKNKEYATDLPKLIVTPIANQFVETFGVKDGDHSQSHFQLKLAEWQYQHKKYAQAFLTSNDALISYVCEDNGLPWDEYDYREAAKKALSGKDRECSLSVDDEMKRWYKSHNNLRNGIAHTTRLVETKKIKGNYVERERTVKEIIDILGDDIKTLKRILSLN